MEDKNENSDTISSFSWSVTTSYCVYLELTGISYRDFFLNPEAGIEVYSQGRKAAKALFPRETKITGPATPPVSYGHINTLGVELVFPEHGEVNHKILCDTLEKGVKILEQKIDFQKSGMFPFYVKYRERLSEAFPGEYIGFTFSAEGPITTAYCLRKDDFFLDIYDQPQLTKRFLLLITQSIIEYKKLLRKLEGLPEVSFEGCGLADDIAAMIPPAKWPEFVIPFLEDYYRGLTTGMRSAHIEDLSLAHLPFLKELDISSFDPSVSPKLNPAIISSTIDIRFSWRLCNFHLNSMTDNDVRDFVFKSIADGASGVFLIITDGMSDKKSISQISTFIEACKESESMAAKGAHRSDFLSLVSEQGKKKFWNHWPE